MPTKNNHNGYKVVPKIKQTYGYPRNQPGFTKAARQSDSIEKKINPAGYKRLNKDEAGMSSDQDLGHITRKGLKYISRKVAPGDRNEVSEDLTRERNLLKKSRGKKK